MLDPFLAAAAGRRAAARHGSAFTTDPARKGLHSWDLNLRLEAQEKEILIKETMKDLHNVVCALHVCFINTDILFRRPPLTGLQVASLLYSTHMALLLR